MAEIVDFGLQQHKIKMDSRYFENVLSVVAGDTGRRLEVQLLDTNGMVQNTIGLNLRLNAVVAGKATFTDATLVDATTGKYRLDLSNGMFLAPGKWQFQWLITDAAGKKLHSFAFTGNVGENISEGGSQATNFYLNLEDLKKMQDDLVNGTIDLSILETNIAEKLTNLETQYTPKLTEITLQLEQLADPPDLTELTSQLAQKADQSDLEIETQRIDDLIANVGGIDETVLKSFKDFTVSIVDFGAKYDDPSFDNMPIIALAQEYVVANGGGTIYFPDYGTLYVKPLLRLKTGVNLLGANSRPVIKLAPDVTNFYGLFLIEYVDHVKISNLTIDSNKENRSNYDISVNPQILITLSEAEYIDVEHNTLIGNGVWLYSCFTGGAAQHSRHLKFNHNHVVWKAGLASVNNEPGMGVEVDNTTIYFDAIDYEVIGNYIETEDGLKNMTCIEQHGANAVLRDNYVDGFRTGVIVWSLVANTPNVSHVKDNNLDVISNTFVNVEAGITNGATSNAEYGDFNLTNVKIHGNKILLTPGRFDRASGRGIEINLRTEGTTLVGRNIEIENNIIDSLPSSRTFADPAAVYNFTGITVGAGRLSGIKVKNNTIRNIHGTGLMVGGGNPEKLFLSDSVIEGNVFIDCGKGGNITFDGFQHRSAINVLRNANTVLERTHIGQNFIYDTKTSGTYLTRAANGIVATDEDQVVMSKSRNNWVGSFKGEFRVQAQTSNVYINPGTQWDVTLTKDICKITAYAYINTTYAGQGLYVHLPYEANITQDTILGTYRHYKVGGEVVTGFFSINASGKKVATFMYPELKATALTNGDRVQIEIEYPVTVLQKYIP